MSASSVVNGNKAGVFVTFAKRRDWSHSRLRRSKPPTVQPSELVAFQGRKAKPQSNKQSAARRILIQHPSLLGRNTMSRIMMVVVTVWGMAALTGSAYGQQKSPKEQLLGAWHLVSIDYVRADGSRSTTFGDNPKGIAFFDDAGHYIISVMRSDRAKYAVNDRTEGTADENRATAQGTITYFGTYTVSEPDRTLNIQLVS